MVRALAAFSGGLDGMLAAQLLLDQGIHVEAVTFDSPFFDAKPAEKSAAQIGIPWRPVDFTEEILNLLFDPPSGFGKNMNPCIDCHAAMFAKLKKMAESSGFDFIFSGEVVGQRPMSQNRGSLNRVKNLSSTGGVLLRPLCAKLLEPTPMEISGLVDRERLLDINGRGRGRQLSMAKQYGFADIPPPAGGCLLTDPGYSLRLSTLKNNGLLTAANARIIKHGRMFLLDRAVALVGRNAAENARMAGLSVGAKLNLVGVPGPLGVLIGEKSKENFQLLTGIMASYTRAEGEVTAVSNGSNSFRARKMDPVERARYSVVL